MRKGFFVHGGPAGADRRTKTGSSHSLDGNAAILLMSIKEEVRRLGGPRTNARTARGQGG